MIYNELMKKGMNDTMNGWKDDFSPSQMIGSALQSTCDFDLTTSHFCFKVPFGLNPSLHRNSHSLPNLLLQSPPTITPLVGSARLGHDNAESRDYLG